MPGQGYMQEDLTTMKRIRMVSGMLLIALLLIGLIYQVFLVGKTTVTLAKNKVWDNRMRSSLSRGADVAYGQSYMQFIDTLLENVPPGANIYVISSHHAPEYSSKAFLQYFMLPRIIRYCPADAEPLSCIQTEGSDDAYFWIDQIQVDLEEAADLGYQSISIGEDQYLLAPGP